MPRVPTYQGPQVRSEALQGGFQQAANSDAAFGGVQARQLQDLGNAAQRFDGQMTQLMERRAIEQAFDIENKIATDWQEFESNVQRTRLGEKATGVKADATAWWDKVAEQYGRDLDPATKRALNKSLSRMRLNALGRADSFELDQLDRAGEAAYQANQGREAETATSFGIAGNQAELEVSLKKISDAARQYRVRKGVPTEVVDAEIKALQGKVHADIVTGLMLNDKAKEAQEYFNRPGVQESFTRVQRADIGDRLSRAVDGQTGQKGAREVFTNFTKDLKPNDALPVDKIDAELVKRYEDKPEALAAARQEFDRQSTLWNRAQSELNAGAVNTVYGLMNRGTSRANIMASPAWANLTEQTKAQFREKWENDDERARARSEAARARVEEKEEVRTAEALVVYTDPRNLARLTREEVIALRPALGDKNWAKLAKNWDTYQQDQVKLSNASFDNDMFNEVLLGAGYDPKPKKGNKQGAATVMRARDAIDNAIAAEQKSKGRELTSQEKRVVAQNVVTARVMIDRPGFDREGAAFEFDPKDLAERGYIMVGPKSSVRLRFSDVPPQDFADVKRFLRETGQPADDVSVMRKWYEHQQTKQKK